MPNIKVLNMKGEQTGTMELADSVFGIEPNTTAMHAVVVNYLANQRQGTQSALTRTEVAGGGKKPWKQKGTGRARQGSTRAPQWRHGGVVFAPKPRDYRYELNKKLRKLAMRSALSAKVADGDLIVIDELSMSEIKTKAMAEVVKAVSGSKKTMFVMPAVDEKVIKSARNIEGVTTALTNTINVYQLLHNDKIVVVKQAAQMLEEVYK